MKTTSWIHFTMMIAALGSFSFPSYAVEGKVSDKEPSPEMRLKMAEMHQMMADCLKSDKPMSECKQEMMKNCPMMKEGGKCPMMGEMDEMMGHSKHPKGK